MKKLTIIIIYINSKINSKKLLFFLKQINIFTFNNSNNNNNSILSAYLRNIMNRSNYNLANLSFNSTYCFKCFFNICSIYIKKIKLRLSCLNEKNDVYIFNIYFKYIYN